MTVGSLFSGIGGLDLGLERAGMQVRWQCEINTYCQRVLRKHWPDVRLYEDIRDIDATTERVDLICGGFPCQPVSLAGKGLAQKDPRWLWPEFARVVGLLRPRYVIVENVPGLRKRGLGDVIGDLAAMGYDSEWQIVSAASVGAPHLRERFIIVAYPGRECEGAIKKPARYTSTIWNTKAKVSGGRSRPSGRSWPYEPNVCRVAYGIPARMDRLRCLGNAVVPQVAELVGRLIMDAE